MRGKKLLEEEEEEEKMKRNKEGELDPSEKISTVGVSGRS